MVLSVVLLLFLFKVASSGIPHRKVCDPEPPRQTPTECSNYKNILYLDGAQARLRQGQEELQQRLQNLEAQLNATKTELEAQLRNKQENCPEARRIAFSAGLVESGEIYRGPSTNKTLVFKKVFSNTGYYNKNTGIFTAPLKGLYFFTFSTYGYNTHVMGAILMKNGHRQISTYDHRTSDGSDSSSNSAILELDVGDRVYVELWHNGRVYDNWNGHTVFSGFLVFPL